jgi:uncharacterized protein (TIGR03437 family)
MYFQTYNITTDDVCPAAAAPIAQLELEKEQKMPSWKALLTNMLMLMAPAGAAAQHLSCTLTTYPRNVRAEGVSELVGDIVLQCVQSRPSPSPSPYLTSEVKLYLNTALTNRLHRSGGRDLTDALLIVGENHAEPTASSVPGGPEREMPVPQYAEVLDNQPNALVWRGVQIPVPGALSPSGRRFPDPAILRITNVRADASSLGIGLWRVACAPSSTRIVVFNFTLNDTVVLPGAVDQLDVAYLQPATSVRVRPGPHADIPACRNLNITGGAVGGTPSFFIRFREGFADSFRPLGTPGTEPGQASEAGYPTPGLGAGGGGASQGSRLLVRLRNVPAGVRLSAPKGITEGKLLLRMTAADSNGAGSFSAISGEDLGETTVTSGTAQFVYEVIASDPSALEQVDIPVIVGFTADATRLSGNIGAVLVDAMLGPDYRFTSLGASASAPIPRFASTGSSWTAFSVVPCCDSCQDPKQIDPSKPLMTRIAPTQLTFRDPMPRLTISGSGFTSGSVIEWEGTTLSTVVSSATEISAPVDLSLLRNHSRDSAQIAVRNANGMRSNAGSIDIVHPFRIDAVVPAGSGIIGLAPGGLATIYGDNLVPSTELAETVPLPRQLQGARVNVQWQQGAMDSPIVYASPSQINFQLPYEVQRSPATISVVNTEGWRRSVSSFISDAAPAIFCSGTTPITTHADGGLVSSARPARPGEVVILYTTGLGRMNNQPPTGSAAPASTLARTTIPVTAPMFGFIREPSGEWRRLTAEGDVLFAGLVPGFIGLGQVNLRIPALLAGSQDWYVVLTMSDSSLSIPVVVQTGNP